MSAISPGSSTRTALEPLRWALGFFLRHLPLVVGLSLIPSVQRAVSQLWGAGWPAAVHVSLEILTGGTRLLLLWLIYRLAITRDDRLHHLSVDQQLERVAAFARRRWPSLVVQGLLLAGALLVFDVIPDRVIAPQVPEHAERTYWAVLLGVKNVTVIAFTFVWMVGALRQMLLDPEG